MDGGVDPSAGDTAWTEPDHHLPAVAAAGYYVTRVLALMVAAALDTGSVASP
jgi:hypothetical protein